MGVMDKIRNLVGKNSDKAKTGIDKASSFLNEKTGGSHSEKIDRARDKAQGFVDQNRTGDDQAHGEPENRDNQAPGDRPRDEQDRGER